MAQVAPEPIGGSPPLFNPPPDTPPSAAPPNDTHSQERARVVTDVVIDCGATIFAVPPSKATLPEMFQETVDFSEFDVEVR
eukprot:3624556-Rhodomonas_salina.1